jgi:hypothetical protein
LIAVVSANAYFFVFLGAVVICLVAAIAAPRHNRPCPRCAVEIAVSARWCRTCGYELPL